MSNIMRRLLFIFTLVAFVNVLMGQVRYFDERYVSSLSYLNPVLINPGATGAEGTHQIIANYRNKWATFPDSPKSIIINYDGPIADNLGFGAQFLSDRNGDLTTTKVQGSLAYTIETSVNKLGVGLSGEYIKHGLDSEVNSHELTQSGDGLINDRIDGNGFFDVSIGVYGVYDNTITYGLALPSLVSSRIDSDSPDTLRGGISYTIGADEKVGCIVGTRFNTLSFNYGYNVSRNEFQTYNNGSHELSLRFDIGGDRSNAQVEDLEVTKMEKEGLIRGEVIQEGINN